MPDWTLPCLVAASLVAPVEPATGAPAASGGPALSDAAAAEPISVRYSERGQRSAPTNEDRWIDRWPPERGMIEAGVYGGVWFPSRHLELFEPTAGFPADGHQLLRLVAPQIGGRGGYYPFRFIGAELEAGVMPTRTLGSGGRASVWALRGQVVGQLGLWSLTPFLLVGVGMLGVASDGPPIGIGREQDVAIHFGGGVKAYINRWIQLRLDIRDVVSNRLGVGEGLTSSPEILLGVSVTLGRRRPDEPIPSRPGIDDRDGDRVLDRDDYCPDLFGVAPRGCPQVCVDDTDGDGLSDPLDQCPNEPESRNGFEDADGCPDEVPPELVELSGVMEGINFDTDKDTIQPGSRPVLDRALETMQRFPDLRVRITGHTDARGGYRHNVDLSRRRAESVKRYLADHGIDPGRIETAGVGPDQPLETNETVQGRAKNRRIEFTIVEADARVSVNSADASGRNPH